ncbi:MAG: TetR family transcriptional regulator [Mycobacteriales bacterium]
MTPPDDVASERSPSREERRRRTEATILEAARELFAETGFERTTIRAVASRAGVDPALVMQYYGNKEGLFAAAARWHVDHKQLAAATLEQIPMTALDDLFSGFEDPTSRDGAIALLRNCLTHESALGVMRDDVMCEPQAMIAKTIGGDEAELRAGLLGATMIGITIAKYLLEIPAVQAASREDIERVMAPVLKALVDPDG